MANYMTEFSPDNDSHVYQVKDSEATPISLLKDTVGWVGKNLFAYPYKSKTKTENGVTFTDNKDGSVTISIASGGATADSTFYFHDQTTGIRNSLLEANKLILSGGISNNIYITVWNAKGDSASVASTGDEALVDFTNQNNDFNIILRVKSGTTLANDITIKPMLRDASILDSTYEPYHKSVEAEIEQVYADNGVLGAKNLFNLDGAVVQDGGLTYTKTSDSITINAGTATGEFLFPTDNSRELVCNPQRNLEYIFSVGDVDLSNTGITLQVYYYVGSGSWTGLVSKPNVNQIRFIVPSNSDGVWVRVRANQVTLSANKTLYPMLRLASDPDDTYVPYAMTNRELTEKVTVQEGAFSDVISGASIDATASGIKKQGNIVTFQLRLSDVTANSYTDLAKIPQGYRPSKTQYITCKKVGADTIFLGQINTGGGVQCSQSLSSNGIIFNSTSWVID